MQVLSAKFAPLVDASDTFTRSGNDVRGQLADLETRLTALRRRWTGDASEAFDVHFADWLDAADGMRATLDELGVLLDTVHGNYREADRASGTLWGERSDGTGQTHAMAAGPQPDGGFRITLDDLRVTAKTFADLQHRLIVAMDRAASALTGTGGMAGMDHVLRRWRDRFDPMAGAVGRASRSVSVVLGVIAQKLTDTANAYIDAENASTPGAPGLDRLPAPDVRFDHTGLIPPSSEGPNPELVPEELAEYWPAAYTDRLRLAGDAWRALQHELVEINNAATAAFTALFDANAGETFSLMRGYWEKLCAAEAPTPCTPDPGAGLRPFNLVSYVTAMVAGSCHDLAALVDNTHRAMAQAAQEAADDEVMKWFGWIAELLDAWRTAGVAGQVVDVGKAVLLGGYLDAERDTYLTHLGWLVDKLLEEDRNRLNLFSDTHDTPQKELPNLTEAADVITGDLRGKWHELTGPHPTPDQIHITPDREQHILVGEPVRDKNGNPKPGKWSGGHRHGEGHSGKTEFPAGWSDEKIIASVLSVARNPDEGPTWDGERFVLYGYRDGIRIKVVVDRDGGIVTGFPPEQPGIPKNP